MGLDKNSLKGMKPEDLTQAQVSAEPSQPSEPVTPATPTAQEPVVEPSVSAQVQEPSSPPSDPPSMDAETEKLFNLAVNTFGIAENKIDESVLKLAKSYAEIQGVSTRTRQELKQFQNMADGLNKVFEKRPDLYDQMKAVAEGKENLTPETRNADNSQQVGKLDNNISVTENELIQQGYLSASELDGLDELTRDRKVFKAEMAFEKDRLRAEYRQGLIAEREQLQAQSQQELDTKTNTQREDEGLKNYALEYGVNFAEVSDDQLLQIKQQMQYIRDPQNPKLITEDAFEIAANRVLGKSFGDKKPPVARKSVDQLVDSGKSFSRNSQPIGNQVPDLEAQLREKAVQNFRNTSSRGQHKANLLNKI